jgi:hypothetical protein
MYVLTDIDEPKQMKSKTANELPSLDKPKTDSADPMRQKVLSDNDEAICTKSITASEEPSRLIP